MKQELRIVMVAFCCLWGVFQVLAAQEIQPAAPPEPSSLVIENAEVWQVDTVSLRKWQTTWRNRNGELVSVARRRLRRTSGGW